MKENSEIKATALVEIDKLTELVAGEQEARRKNPIRDLFKATVKLATESPGTLNLKIAATVLKELRYSFKMFYPDRLTRKITIFGSARVPEGDAVYELAKSFAQHATKRKYMIITGGGPGVMAAGNEGAKTVGSFGLNIRLPMEQEANPFVQAKEHLINYKYFFTRKLFLVKEASAFALFPGGFGTMDETFEVLTLIQTGKSDIIPIVLMEAEGTTYWESFIKFSREVLLERKLIAESDLHLFKICNKPEEAMDYIEKFYKNYHSMRLVKDSLAVRIHKPLSDAALKKANSKFQHLSQNQPIVQSGALPEETNEPELKDMTRLVFPFDRTDFSGLRALIDFVNEPGV